MKKLTILLILAIALGAGMMGAMPGVSQAQVYPPPPPPGPVVVPYVGPNTPWVYYAGDWFLNGILYYFFGPRYGWAPYYAYPETFIVRPSQWYGPHWVKWYGEHPVFLKNFQHSYPIWSGHAVGHHYGEEFYNKYHPGHGGGWHRGVPGREFHESHRP